MLNLFFIRLVSALLQQLFMSSFLNTKYSTGVAFFIQALFATFVQTRKEQDYTALVNVAFAQLVFVFTIPIPIVRRVLQVTLKEENLNVIQHTLKEVLAPTSLIVSNVLCCCLSFICSLHFP